MPEALVSPVAPDQAPLLARPYYGASGASPIVTSLAHVPEALEVTMPLVACVLGPSAIDARTKELVIVRTSALLECRYCVQTHSAVALDSGVTAEEVRALCGDRSWEGRFEREDERALLAWVDAVAGGRGALPAEAGERMRAHHSEAELVELTLLCAATMMLNRYCTALELPTSEGTLQRLATEGLL
ncbi:MAG: carboxymuconolactone decarboxylase family protein [Solirubrobacteraceae bacterium]